MSLYSYPHEHDGPGWGPHKVANQKRTDPVCYMTVGRDAHRTLDRGRAVLFCSMPCKERFLAEPARYRHASVVMPGRASDLTPARSVAQGTEYTCPMHPEIVRGGPGNCPICGMALEPRTTALHVHGPDPELRDVKRRFWLAAAFTLPLFIIVMAEMLGVQLLSGRTRVSMAIGLATPVCVWAAWPIYVRFTQSLRNRRLNLFTLVGLGVGIAYVYSVVAALVPGVFPSSSFRHDGTVASYFEVAAVIVTLVLLSQVLGLRARSQTGAAIQKLRVVAATSGRERARLSTELTSERS